MFGPHDHETMLLRSGIRPVRPSGNKGAKPAGTAARARRKAELALILASASAAALPSYVTKRQPARTASLSVGEYVHADRKAQIASDRVLQRFYGPR